MPSRPSDPAIPTDPARPSSSDFAGIARAEIVGVSELLLRVILASRAVDRQRPSHAPELTPHAVRATIHLFQHGQGTVGELAEGLGVSMGWASRIADELERVGHILRERDALDRRVVHLRLSPAATRLAEDMYLERGRAVAEALAVLEPQEREAVRRFLTRLIDELEGLAGPPAAPPP
jgi:DNA-binding MarR family transcriptional regulator